MINLHIKYFQPLADIRCHYESILNNFDGSRFGSSLLDTWGISLDEKELILEEMDVLNYLIACRLGIARKNNAKKPSIEVVNRCFNRHLDFLEKIHNCHQWNVNKNKSKLVAKQYKACRHYLFKFSLPAWEQSLPAEIPTYENKYKHLEDEEELPIPKI